MPGKLAAVVDFRRALQLFVIAVETLPAVDGMSESAYANTLGVATPTSLRKYVLSVVVSEGGMMHRAITIWHRLKDS